MPQSLLVIRSENRKRKKNDLRCFLAGNIKMNGVKDELFRIGCVKRAQPGEFWTLKSGETSDIYIDLRILPQYPKLMSTIAGLLPRVSSEEDGYVAGLPIGGIPLATLYAQRTRSALLLIRKVPKKHGTSKMVEVDYSSWTAPRELILVDDVLTTGSTVLETIEMLKSQQIPLKVTAVVCVVNRSNPLQTTVPGTDVPIHSLLTLEELFARRRTFADRLEAVPHAVARRLFRTMIDKKTNLCLSADVDSEEKLLELLTATSPYIAMIKVHFDAIEPNASGFRDFMEAAEAQNVVVMSDRKYADIGSTIRKKLERWEKHPACCTVHTFSGPGAVEALHSYGIGAVLVAEMSNQGSLTEDEFFSSYYAAKTAALAKSMSNVMGLVCQSRASCEAGDQFIYMTPGVHEANKSDGADQRYRTCHEAIAIQNNDMVIVGRGIYDDVDPVAAAIRYRDAAWAALSK